MSLSGVGLQSSLILGLILLGAYVFTEVELPAQVCLRLKGPQRNILRHGTISDLFKSKIYSIY